MEVSLVNTNEFGQKLKKFRVRRGVSQSKLAERSDLDHSYVSRLEKGGRLPTKNTVEKLAVSLTLTKTEQDVLLASAGYMPKDVSSLIKEEPLVAEILKMLTDPDVSDDQRIRIRKILAAQLESMKVLIYGERE